MSGKKQANQITRREFIKNVGLSVGGMALASTVLASGTTSNAATTLTGRFSTAWAPSHVAYGISEKFAELIQAKTQGRVKLDKFQNSQLYKGDQEVMACSTGAVDMIGTYENRMAYYDPDWQIEKFPFLMPEYADLMKFWATDAGKAIIKRDEAQLNVKILGFIEIAKLSMTVFNKVRPIKTIDDFKGIKIRSDLPVSSDALSAYGMSPVIIPLSECFTSLQTGMIDGIYTTAASYLDSIYTICPYALNMNWTNFTTLYVANRAWWEKVSASDQAIILKEVMPEIAIYASQQAKKDYDKLLALQQQGKITLTTLSDKDKAKMIERAKPVWTKWRSIVSQMAYNGAVEVANVK